MKKKLQFLVAGAATFFLAVTGLTATASHYQGSEMNYTAIAPGVYAVQLKLYRDCTGASAPTSAQLNIKANACNAGRSVSMAKVGGSRIGDPYCPTIPKICNSTSVNYEEVIFRATVTFSASEMQCPDWILSWSECCRPASAGLANASSYALYTEAALKLSVNQNGTVIPVYNSSPEFGSLVTAFMNPYKPITLSAYALDADNDSLVYSLETPLDNPTTPLPYINYTTVVIQDPDTNSTKTAIAPSGTFSATFPMHSFDVDWTQATPVATPYFDLNTQNGSLSFTPTAYFPNSTAVQGLNKYVVVVKVDEYRRINGQAVKIGTIRRDMFFALVDCGPNANPVVSTPVVNGQAITPNDIISLRPGTPLNFTFSASDANPNDVLEMTSDAVQMLPGSNFSVTSAAHPTGSLIWIPTANDVRDQIYYFRIMVKDNACPVRGVQVQTFGVRVSNTGGVTGTKDALAVNAGFTAFPNPFTDKINFRFNLGNKAERIIIYNALGRQVDVIALDKSAAADQQVQWHNAGKYAAGMYVAKLIAGNKTVQTIKFTKQQ